jgi:hypothetical protein
MRQRETAMTWKKLSLVGGALVALLAAEDACALRAQQQAFLPPMFKLGAKITLQLDRSRVYTVLAQQGAWIRVAASKAGSPEADDTEIWIYAPSGTVWSQAR